jgi:hypothetical protein
MLADLASDSPCDAPRQQVGAFVRAQRPKSLRAYEIGHGDPRKTRPFAPFCAQIGTDRWRFTVGRIANPSYSRGGSAVDDARARRREGSLSVGAVHSRETPRLKRARFARVPHSAASLGSVCNGCCVQSTLSYNERLHQATPCVEGWSFFHNMTACAAELPVGPDWGECVFNSRDRGLDMLDRSLLVRSAPFDVGRGGQENETRTW